MLLHDDEIKTMLVGHGNDGWLSAHGFCGHMLQWWCLCVRYDVGKKQKYHFEIPNWLRAVADDNDDDDECVDDGKRGKIHE